MTLGPQGLELRQILQRDVEQRFWNNDPPEARQALNRLEAGGYSTERAKEKILSALARAYDESPKAGFNLERFKQLLNALR